MKKPPLGLTPRVIHDEHRLAQIHAAIARYDQANKEIPQEWLEEKNELECHDIFKIIGEG